VKVRPIPDQLREFNDGYRGDPAIGWELVFKKKRVFEHYATFCARCGQSWGWSFDLAKMKILHRVMRARGCPRCPKSSKKSQSASK
jgi:ribosomal protein S27AE